MRLPLLPAVALRPGALYFVIFIQLAAQGRFLSLFFKERGLSDSQIGSCMALQVREREGRDGREGAEGRGSTLLCAVCCVLRAVYSIWYSSTVVSMVYEVLSALCVLCVVCVKASL